jgi:hypothetical protein
LGECEEKEYVGRGKKESALQAKAGARVSGGISFYFILSLSSEQQKRSCQPRDVAFPLPHCQTRDDGRCWSPSFPPRFSSALGLTFAGECHSARPTSSQRPKIVAIFLFSLKKIQFIHSANEICIREKEEGI